MKRKLAGILLLAILLSLLPVPALAAEKAPDYYLYNGKSFALLDTKNFEEAVRLCYGYTLVADGGAITLSKNTDVADCGLVLNNAALTLKKGQYYFGYYPCLLGSAKLSFTAGAKYCFGLPNSYSFLVGNTTDYYFYLKSGSMTLTNTSGKGAVDIANPNDAAKALDASWKKMPVETITINGTVTATNFMAYRGDTIVVNKGATLTASEEFYLPEAKLINYGTLNVDGLLGVSDLILIDDNMPDIDKYTFNNDRDVKRYYNDISRYLDRVAGTSKIGSKLDNYGVIKGSGLLVVLKDSTLTNYGSIVCDEIYNTGKVINANGTMDTLMAGNARATSAKNSSRYVVTFYLAEDLMSYTTTVQAGKAFGKASNKNVQAVLEGFAPWYLDKKFTLPFNYQTTVIEGDTVLYNQIF